MAESELITKEDIDELDGVLQLHPHFKNTTFETVVKTEDGDLVSLDELYEKTGQESIGKFIEGFDIILNNNKLTREHGLALKIRGAENWMVLPDRLNGIKGSEGFFSTLRDGFIAIIKAIINFIKGICNWIVTRIKALFGWGETRKQTLYLYEKSEYIKEVTKELLDTLDVNMSDKAWETIPNGLTATETFTVIKKRIESNEEAFVRLGKAVELIKDYKKNLNKWTSQAPKMRSAKDKIIDSLRRDAKSGRLTVSRLEQAKAQLDLVVPNHVDIKAISEKMKEILETLYEVRIDNLDDTTGIKEATDQIRKSTETLKVGYTDGQIANLNKSLNKAFIISAETDSDDLDKTIIRDIEVLKKIGSLDEVEFIDKIEDNLVDESKERINFKMSYTKFMKDCSGYSSLLNSYITEIQKIELSIDSAMRWKSKAEMILAAYITRDLNKVAAAMVKCLTPEEQVKFKNMVTNTDGLVPLDIIDKSFYKNATTNVTVEKVSGFFNTVINSSKGKFLNKNLAKFRNQLKGE